MYFFPFSLTLHLTAHLTVNNTSFSKPLNRCKPFSANNQEIGQKTKSANVQLARYSSDYFSEKKKKTLRQNLPATGLFSSQKRK